MKKKLVAMVVAGALTAPLAHAQTANVTLYGRLNMDIDFVSSPDESGLGKLHRVSSNSSRIGVRGSESLGGHLNAIFQIESAVAADVGGGTLASRDTWLGLQGSWGAVKLGNMLTPYDTIHAFFGNAPTYTASILHTGGLWGQYGLSKANGGFGSRMGNSVRYDSPKMGGFYGQAQYSTDENADNKGWLGSLGLFYDNAGIQAGLAYERNHKLRGVGVKNDQAFTATAAYKFGSFRPALVYEYLDYDVPGVDNLKRHLYGGSLTVDIGPGKLYGAVLSAGKGKGTDGTAVGNLHAGEDTGAMLYELSYTYELSKKTSVYAGYVMIDNKKNATYTFGQNGHGRAAAGKDQQGIILGAVHFF